MRDAGHPARGGYVLAAAPAAVDLHRFHSLVDRARDCRCGDDERAALLGQALELDRGEPLAGLGGPWAARMRAEWNRQRLEAVLAWAQAELQLGNPDVVIGVLSELIVENPLVEPLAAVLMRALSAAGRSAEALHCYAGVRERLIEQLGTEPGDAVQRLSLAILRGELQPPAATVNAVPYAATFRPSCPSTRMASPAAGQNSPNSTASTRTRRLKWTVSPMIPAG